MSRNTKIINLATEEALKSTQTFRHGAVITKGSGKIICSGYNKGARTKILNQVFTCTHAEMDVLNKLVNCFLIPKYGKNYKQHCKKYSIWVTRIQRNGIDHLKTPKNKKKQSLEEHLPIINSDSKPCYFCSKMLKEFGIKRVYYTISSNEIEVSNVDQLISNHKSDCQLKTEDFFKNNKI